MNNNTMFDEPTYQEKRVGGGGKTQGETGGRGGEQEGGRVRLHRLEEKEGGADEGGGGEEADR